MHYHLDLKVEVIPYGARKQHEMLIGSWWLSFVDFIVLFLKRYTNPFIMVQEPYVNGKNFIPNPVSVLKVFARNDRNIRLRACVY